MALPEPRPGLVFRYDYLWSHEERAGRVQGKDRPACLVAAVDLPTLAQQVVILPITHRPPTGDSVGIEIPAKVKLHLGLDDMPSWIIVSEHNVDSWPNAGLSPIPGQPRGTYAFGFIPPGLFRRVKSEFLNMLRAGRGGPVRRE